MNNQNVYAFIMEDNNDNQGDSSTAWHWTQRHAENGEDFGVF
jgi:hypothetical protein